MSGVETVPVEIELVTDDGESHGVVETVEIPRSLYDAAVAKAGGDEEKMKREVSRILSRNLRERFNEGNGE